MCLNERFHFTTILTNTYSLLYFWFCFRLFNPFHCIHIYPYYKIDEECQGVSTVFTLSLWKRGATSAPAGEGCHSLTTSSAFVLPPPFACGELRRTRRTSAASQASEDKSDRGGDDKSHPRNIIATSPVIFSLSLGWLSAISRVSATGSMCKICTRLVPVKLFIF